MPPKYRGTKGLVGIIANDSARYSLFASCVTRLQLPPGWEIQWLIGGDWCGARNQLCQAVLDEGYSHLWFMDDDHAFSPDILTRLTSHEDPEKPGQTPALVNPMCLTRVAPFAPVTYTTRDDSAEHRYFPIPFEEMPAEGLVELEAAGCAGMLIRRDVLVAMKDDAEYDAEGYFVERIPWFEYGDRSEDIIFCEKAKAAGFQLYGDLGARLGHITTCVVIPDYVNGDWHTRLEIGGGFNVFTSPATSWEETGPPGGEPDPSAFEVGADPDDIEGVAFGEDGRAPDESIQNPCLICGNESTWTDIHGQRGCAAHPPNHEAWATFYERAEIWLKEDENRWHGRLLNGDGGVAILLRPTIQEAQMVSAINADFPDLAVHHIQGELDDSRRERTGPPLRLWDHKPRQS